MSTSNAKQSIPEVFRLIIENDRECEELWDLLGSGWMTMKDWKRLKELRKYRRESLRPAAEKALRWNTDKGNTA